VRVGPLRMVPVSCSLDAPGLSGQRERYRLVGQGASVIEWDRRRLVIRVRDEVSDVVVQELLAVERGCCPFFELDWNPGQRHLRIAVSASDHEPALEAIGYALGLAGSPDPRARSGADRARAATRP
jgi:hypothetical protein